MNRIQPGKFVNIGGVSFLAGVIMLACFVALTRLPSLRGPYVTTFLVLFALAALAYTLTVIRLENDRLPLGLIWVFAITFRLILLTNPPTLSDDVFRYIWDGHLFNQGINPYAYPVNSPLLDLYTTQLRESVNHNWMASPYLPSSQVYFAIVNWLRPQSPLGFQAAAFLLDLSAGWLVMDILRMLGLPKRLVLIYLWNPLVIVEFAHGAHIEAWMIAMIMATFWLMVRAKPLHPKQKWLLNSSVITQAAATLTKGLPLLLTPLFLRRWEWKRIALYGGILLGISWMFAAGAGWGLTGPLDGRGLFGALRIFMSYWNFNSGIYHWLEVLTSGYQTPGAVPIEVVGESPIFLARTITSIAILLASLATAIWAWRLDDPKTNDHERRSLYLMRLAVIPLGAYLLFTHTVHPWYVTIMIPFLPFLMPKEGETKFTGRFVWPWIYFSCAVAFSYLTYIDPEDFREFYAVRRLEYLPFYLLLVWAAWPFFSRGVTWILDRGTR
jgi:hypothetical protein